jgi:rhodanese-related sulfurtransferase
MKLLSRIFAVAMVVLLSMNMASAKKLSKKKMTPQGLYLTAKEAYKFVNKNQSKVLFVDVRTQEEIEFVGSTPLMDKNIPFAVKNLKKWNAKKKRFLDVKNKNFAKDIGKALKVKGLNKNSDIVLMCRSGSRSAKAAKVLFKQGYKKVYTVTDGFEGGKSKKTKHRTINGWKNAGNPWGYHLDKSKAYNAK